MELVDESMIAVMCVKLPVLTRLAADVKITWLFDVLKY